MTDRTGGRRLTVLVLTAIVGVASDMSLGTEQANVPVAITVAGRPRLRAALSVLAVLAVAVFLHFVDPVESLEGFPCPFHALTGLHCPGCGTLRALHAVVHGHLTRALDLNPLTVFLLPFLAYPFLSNVLLAVRGRGLPHVLVPSAAAWLLLGVIIVFWVLRNVPVYPFTLLAP